MNLLENSQTFLGVLLTLNVLCIFYERSNNFIIRTLSEQREKKSKRVQRLVDKSIEIKEAFFCSDDYKSVERLCYATNKSQQVRDKANDLKLSASIGLGKQSTDITETETKIDRIEHSNEQIRGPFYSLLFGIVVFMIDEIFHFEGTLSPYLLFGTYVFTILSYAYWMVMWITFFIHTSHEESECNTHKSRLLTWIDNHLKIGFGSAVKFIICGILYSLVLDYIDINSMSVELQTLIIGIAFTLPILLIGIWRMIECNVKGSYSIIHTSGHLVGFLIFSALIATITYLFGLHNVSNTIFFQNNRLLNLLIITFVLLNGLVLPFVFPYIKYHFLYEHQIKELKRDQEATLNTIESFKNQFKEFCAEIVNEEQNHQDSKNSSTGEVKTPEVTAVQIDWTAYIKEYEETPNRPSIDTFCRNKKIDAALFRSLRNKHLHPRK